MVSFILILIGLTLWYAAISNRAGDLFVALATGQAPQPGTQQPPVTTTPPQVGP